MPTALGGALKGRGLGDGGLLALDPRRNLARAAQASTGALALYLGPGARRRALQGWSCLAAGPLRLWFDRGPSPPCCSPNPPSPPVSPLNDGTERSSPAHTLWGSLRASPEPGAPGAASGSLSGPVACGQVGPWDWVGSVCKASVGGGAGPRLPSGVEAPSSCRWSPQGRLRSWRFVVSEHLGSRKCLWVLKARQMSLTLLGPGGEKS